MTLISMIRHKMGNNFSGFSKAQKNYSRFMPQEYTVLLVFVNLRIDVLFRKKTITLQI